MTEQPLTNRSELEADLDAERSILNDTVQRAGADFIAAVENLPQVRALDMPLGLVRPGTAELFAVADNGTYDSVTLTVDYDAPGTPSWHLEQSYMTVSPDWTPPVPAELDEAERAEDPPMVEDYQRIDVPAAAALFDVPESDLRAAIEAVVPHITEHADQHRAWAQQRDRVTAREEALGSFLDREQAQQSAASDAFNERWHSSPTPDVWTSVTYGPVSVTDAGVSAYLYIGTIGGDETPARFTLEDGQLTIQDQHLNPITPTQLAQTIGLDGDNTQTIITHAQHALEAAQGALTPAPAVSAETAALQQRLDEAASIRDSHANAVSMDLFRHLWDHPGADTLPDDLRADLDAPGRLSLELEDQDARVVIAIDLNDEQRTGRFSLDEGTGPHAATAQEAAAALDLTTDQITGIAEHFGSLVNRTVTVHRDWRRFNENVDDLRIQLENSIDVQDELDLETESDLDPSLQPAALEALWVAQTTEKQTLLHHGLAQEVRNSLDEIDSNLRAFAEGGYPPDSDELNGIYVDAIARTAIPYGESPISVEEVARQLRNIGYPVPTIDLDTIADRTGITPLDPSWTREKIDGDFGPVWESAVGSDHSIPVTHGPVLDYGYGTPSVTITLGDSWTEDNTFRVTRQDSGELALTVTGDDPTDVSSISEATGVPEHEIQAIVDGAGTALASTLPAPETPTESEPVDPALKDVAAARLDVRRAIASISEDSEAAQEYLTTANARLNQIVDHLRPDQAHEGVLAAQESVQQASEKVAAVADTAAKVEAEVTVYSLPDCVGCAATKRALDKAGVEYEEIPLQEHPELVNRFKQQGLAQAPIVETSDGDRWAGYNPGKLKEHGLDHRSRQQRAGGTDRETGQGR
jgi:glutaredoxin